MPAHWNPQDGPCPLCSAEQADPDALHIVLHVDHDQATRGHWCAWCNLPSVVITPIRVTCVHGWPASALAVPPVAYCDEHDEAVPLPRTR